jgi:glucose-1-phosphate thymidylyltransferase
LRPKVVSQYLLESMYHAGVRKAYIVINRGKWDIPAYYGPGTKTGIDLAYVVTDYAYGAPFSLKQALPFVSDATIIFGFPDIRFTPVAAFTHLLKQKYETDADLVLGLFKAADPPKMDMVRLDNHGDVTAIHIKPVETTLTYTWIIAVWSPRFTTFMSVYLNELESELERGGSKAKREPQAEYYVGQVIQAALGSDLKLSSVIFESGEYIDIGTPKNLVLAMTQMNTGEDIK